MAKQEGSPIQICMGNMALGDTGAAVDVYMISPNDKRRSPPSKVYVSDAAVARAPATTTGIKGCGEWATHVMQGDGIRYMSIRISHMRGRSKIVRLVVLRVHADAPIQVIHAKIPHHRHSTMANGKVPAFTGRADILTADEVEALGLDVKLEQLMEPEELEEAFIAVTTMVDPKHKGTATEIKVTTDEAGRKVEVQTKRKRRVMRIRK